MRVDEINFTKDYQTVIFIGLVLPVRNERTLCRVDDDVTLWGRSLIEGRMVN